MAYPTEPTIEIDDLAPRATLGGYHATWQEGGMRAYVYLEPIEDQPARGYILDSTYQTVSGREPGPRQRDQGAALSVKLRELMTKSMIDAGWQPYPVAGIGLAWQHESRLRAPEPVKQGELVIPKKAAPVKEARKLDEVIATHQAERKAARQVEQDQAKQRTLQIPARSGDARRNIKGYKRTITATPVTFTCERCKSEATRTIYPGKRPQYCDACAVEVKREKTRARVARLRAGQKTP